MRLQGEKTDALNPWNLLPRNKGLVNGNKTSKIKEFLLNLNK